MGIGDILTGAVTLVIAVIGLLLALTPITTSARPRPFWPSALLFACSVVAFGIAWLVWVYR